MVLCTPTVFIYTLLLDVFTCSQHGITCVGFRDKIEKDKFCHQLDRTIRWLGEKADKQKDKVLEKGERERGKVVPDGGKYVASPHK